MKEMRHEALIDTHQFTMQTFFLLGLLRLQSIFQELSFTDDSFRIDVVKQISTASEALEILRGKLL